MMGHLVFHLRGGIDAGEDEAGMECGIEAAVLGMSEPDEVSGSVIEGNAVEVMTLEVRVVMGSMPSGGDKEVDEIGVLGGSNDFVGLFTAIVDTA